VHGYKSTLLDQEFNCLEQLLDGGGGSIKKVGWLKYSALNVNIVYVVMIFTAFYLKSRGALAHPPNSTSYVSLPMVISFSPYQVVDYAARKAMPVAEVEKWLSSVLAYDP